MSVSLSYSNSPSLFLGLSSNTVIHLYLWACIHKALGAFCAYISYRQTVAKGFLLNVFNSIIRFSLWYLNTHCSKPLTVKGYNFIFVFNCFSLPIVLILLLCPQSVKKQIWDGLYFKTSRTVYQLLHRNPKVLRPLIIWRSTLMLWGVKLVYYLPLEASLHPASFAFLCSGYCIKALCIWLDNGRVSTRIWPGDGWSSEQHGVVEGVLWGSFSTQMLPW